MDTAEFLHLVDFSGQRDANFLTDEQEVGLESWISLKYLVLGDPPFQAFILKRFVVSRLNGAKKFPSLNLVLAKIEISRGRVVSSAVTAGLDRRGGKLCHEN